MRKAVANARRGARRKNKGNSESNSDGGNNGNHNSNGTVNSPGGDSIRNPSPKAGERRKPTENEAVLTAKNYRLAKELSELRVRHREETKNVTRLTMENMNLASRCREAISRVNELKKELAMHQRRTAQALATQRNHNRSASVGDAVIFGASDAPLSGGRADQVLVDMDHMDDLMAAQSSGSSGSGSQRQSRLQPKMVNGTSSRKLYPLRTDSPTEEDMFVDFDSPDNDAFVTATTTRLMDSPPLTPAADGDEEIGSDFTPADDIMATMDDFFPETASPKLERKTDYDEGFPDDLTSQSVARPKLSSVFRSQSGKLLETTDEGSVGSSQSDGLAAKLSPTSKTQQQRAKQQQQQQSQSSQQQQQQQKPVLSMSSIDAFEASFATTFPRSFSSSPETATKMSELDESGSDRSSPEQSKKRTYDPFQVTPQVTRKSSGDLTATPTNGPTRSRDPPAAKSGTPKSTRASSLSSLQSTDDETLPPTPRRHSEENGNKPNLVRSSSSGRRNRAGSPNVLGADGDVTSSSVRSLRSRLERNSSDSASSPEATTTNSSGGGGSSSQQQRKNKTPSPTYLETPDFNNEKAASARARYEKALQASQPRSYTGKSPRTVGRLNPNKFLESQNSSEDLLAIAVSKSEEDDEVVANNSNKEKATNNNNNSSPSNHENSPSDKNGSSIAQEKTIRPSEIRAAAERERKSSPTPTSLILKRLQQRRAKEQARNNNADGGVNLSTISGISRAESRRRLNARVAAHLASPEGQQHVQLTPSPSDEESPLNSTHKTAGNNSDPPMFRRSYSGGSQQQQQQQQRRSFGVDELMGHEDSYADSGDYQRKKSISSSGSSPEKTSKQRYSSSSDGTMDSPEAIARTARARERARRSNSSGGTNEPSGKRSDVYFPKTRPKEQQQPALVSPELGTTNGDALRDLAKTVI